MTNEKKVQLYYRPMTVGGVAAAGYVAAVQSIVQVVVVGWYKTLSVDWSGVITGTRNYLFKPRSGIRPKLNSLGVIDFIKM